MISVMAEEDSRVLISKDKSSIDQAFINESKVIVDSARRYAL
jgi:hypothetical protein